MRKNNNMLKGKWKIEGVRFFLHPPPKKKNAVFLLFCEIFQMTPCLPAESVRRFQFCLKCFWGRMELGGLNMRHEGSLKPRFCFSGFSLSR